MQTAFRIVILIAVLASGTACTALAIGGAAAGGYVVGKDDRPVGQIVDDGTITASIKTKLIRSKYVDAVKVNVDTHDGVVTLRGRVDNFIAREQAEALANDTKGVRSVVNQLEVIPVGE